MIVELGLYTLILALLASMLQGGLSLAGAARRNTTWVEAGRQATYMAFFLVTVSFTALTYAHLTDDFSVKNVYANSHTLKPLLYKIAGVWGNHEGSMLLWVLLLTGYGAAMARFMIGMPADLRAYALGVQGLMGIGFIAFILFTSNPFERLWPIPPEGSDLNPLLQDPALAAHPPLLYLGYVGFSSVFSLAAAQLLSNSMLVPWARWLRPWTMIAWSSLTIGIALGSWWAYYELGWGGWWFWDPVENAALLPWLVGTALLHSLMSTAQRKALARWTILLAIIAFSLSLLGTFLVRSGVLTSVHSFASDPTRGIFILLLLILATGGAFTLYAFRAATSPASPAFTTISRETAMLVNNLLLCAAATTVMVGTLYPMLLDALGGGIVSVGAPYFNMTVLPLLMPLIILMALGPFLAWRQADAPAALRQLRGVFIVSLLSTIVTLYVTGFKSVLGLMAVFLGIWLLGGTIAHIRKIRKISGGAIAHFGLAISILGMAGSTFSTELTMPMRLHEKFSARGYQIEFAELNNVRGPNYIAERGVFHIWRNNYLLGTLTPERRYYPTQDMVLSDVAIHTNLLRDIYLVMGEPLTTETKDTVTPQRNMRLQLNPLVPWIWIGAGIMAIGGITAIWPRRRREDNLLDLRL